jgi:hypothetical protein
MGYLALTAEVRYGKKNFTQKSEKNYLREAGVLIIKIVAVYEKYSAGSTSIKIQVQYFNKIKT